MALAPTAALLYRNFRYGTAELPLSVRIGVEYVVLGVSYSVVLCEMRCGAGLTPVAVGVRLQNAIGPIAAAVQNVVGVMFEMTAAGELELTMAAEVALRGLQDLCLNALVTEFDGVLVPSALEHLSGAYPERMVNVVAIERRRNLFVARMM